MAGFSPARYSCGWDYPGAVGPGTILHGQSLLVSRVMMNAIQSSSLLLARPSRFPRGPLLLGISLTLFAVGLSLILALILPKGYPLAFVGDVLQTGLIGAATILALQNAIRSHGQIRIFWFFMSLGATMWFVSLFVWTINELWLRHPVPDVPFADVLIFVKLVPLAAAASLEPDKTQDSRFRAFGLLDLSVLILYSIYLFAFFVFAYRLLPGARSIYDFHFDLADAMGNQFLAVVAGVAYLRARGPWKQVFGIFFLSNVSYAIASDLIDSAIDLGKYYTGSLYDLPLIAGLSGFVCFCLVGRSLLQPGTAECETPPATQKSARRNILHSSQLAMLVTLSTPAIGLWLLTTHSSPERLFSFRLELTLLTIFLLTLLLSIKQDFLSVNLLGSLKHLSSTYSSIDRFKDHLVQSEKLATLGESVASVADEISNAMISIREQASRITSRSNADSRSHSLAGKIGHYAQRTDALVENMQRFAQEAPLQLAPVEMKPLVESALHLSRIGKLPNVRVRVEEDAPSPPVLGDSSQLLHVFLQLIANAIDALEEVGGGELVISLRVCDPQVCIQFADTGPGLKNPEHVFEPFFTTKPVGKGTGLGLSTCYGIIRQHDGDISCGNRLEGGAFFTIFLPASRLPASAAVGSLPVTAGETR